jgi:hypothetical protein
VRFGDAHDYDVVGELIDEAPALSNSRPNEAFRILANA